MECIPPVSLRLGSPNNYLMKLSQRLLISLCVFGLCHSPETCVAEDNYGSPNFNIPSDSSAFAGVTIEEMNSYSGEDAQLNIGLDGSILLTCIRGKEGKGLVWVVDPAGKSLGSAIGTGSITTMAARNTAGVTAVVARHGAHSVTFFDKSFKEIRKDNEYRAGEELGGESYLNPTGVYAGASGKFYVYDLYDKQIVVYTSEGSREKTIPLVSDALSGDLALLYGRMFPDEANKRFVLVAQKAIHTFDIEGKETGVFPVRMGTIFTMNEKGNFFRFKPATGEVEELSASGDLINSVELEVDEPFDGANRADFIGVHGDTVYLKRLHAFELFQKYKLSDGSFVGAVEAKHSGTVTPAPPADS